MLKGIFRTKNLDDILSALGDETHRLKRSLGPLSITLLGIGAIIGAGIFATVGTAAAGDASRPGAGPSLMLSFAITAVVCAFTALCYAEMAAMVPISGSAYTYSYATLGELVAWIIGWDLILEYAIGNVAVAISWGNYFRSLMHDALGVDIPQWLSTDFRTARKIPGLIDSAPHIFGIPIVFNLLAFGIVALITIVLVWGIKESAEFNAVMVGVKIIVLTFFIGFLLYMVTPAKMATNWRPFQPAGWGGTLAGAAVVFFAYIGFDAVSTVAEETKNPARDLPIGIIASLIICTIFYVVVVDFGSVVAHTAVLLVFQLGQPRIFFSMARDGLLPPVFAKVHPKFKTPHVTTILTGVIVGLFAAVMSIDEMVDLTNIGTLFAFVLVCIGITILRYKDPGRHRPFRVPLGAWFLPMLGAFSCVFLMYYLPPTSWWRFIAWLMIGLSIYLSYGYARSELGGKSGRSRITPSWLSLMGLGSLLIAVGILTVPHSSSPSELYAKAMSGMGEGKRTMIAFGSIGIGLVCMLIGLLMGISKGEAAKSG